MAALPYMQLYIADYLADTMHLTAEEHGAYILLMFNYWQTGRPLRKSRLQTIAKISNDRWNSVEVSLSEFFNDDGVFWSHTRIDRDLLAVKSSQNQRSAAGKASAEARARRKLGVKSDTQANENIDNSNGRSTVVEISLNENSTNKDTDTDKNKNTTSISDEIDPNSSGDQGNSKSKIPSCPYQQILDAYHETLPELPKIEIFSDARKSKIKAIWNSHESMRNLEKWNQFFQYIRKSDFLMGRTDRNDGHANWKPNLEWLVKPSNFAKIIEKHYHRTPSNAP